MCGRTPAWRHSTATGLTEDPQFPHRSHTERNQPHWRAGMGRVYIGMGNLRLQTTSIAEGGLIRGLCRLGGIEYGQTFEGSNCAEVLVNVVPPMRMGWVERAVENSVRAVAAEQCNFATAVLGVIAKPN